MSDETFVLTRGGAPFVLSAPHVGTLLPDGLRERLTPAGRSVIDTDWYVDRLYDFVRELGTSTIVPRWSRYLVDLNRDPDGVSLYPGARTTGLCPTETFEGEPLYLPGEEPSDAEVAERRAAYWEPYHAALRAEIARVRAAHGYALLLDAHSIWGRLPLLFEGELPDVNVGTNAGASCDPALTDALVAAVEGAPYSHVVNGRFKGGYITRHYGDPARSVQAVQIELNQRTYLADGSRTEWDQAKAARLSAVLQRAVEALLARESFVRTTKVVHGPAEVVVRQSR